MTSLSAAETTSRSAGKATTDRAAPAQPGARVLWVDFAKAWSIILVVTMHSTLHVGLEIGGTGWLHEVVAFAKPFRMPDFFLVSGLFLGRIVDRPWREFLDRRVLHFAYFYALWLFIELVLKSAHMGLTQPADFLRAYLWGFVEPFSSMWFIQILPFFFLTARLVRRLPTALVLAVAASLHLLAALHPAGGVYALESRLTNFTTINSFCMFFIYFIAGHLFRRRIFDFAEWMRARPGFAIAGLLAWAVLEQSAVRAGLPELPGPTLVLGFAGAFAVIALSTLAARAALLRPFAYCGRNSLVIYLSFFVPMAATRTLLVKTAAVTDVGFASLIVASVAVVAPLLLHAATRDTPLAFLYKRPAWARLAA
jgi:uncharacterized membrane protein YcfT